MANVFSLDSLREAAQEEFADLEIPVSDTKTIKLLNPLRLSEEQRDEIREFFNQLGDAEEDEEVEGGEAKEGDDEEAVTMFDIIKEILVRVAETREDGDFLIESIGDDRPLLLVVFNRWSDRTQAGEA